VLFVYFGRPGKYPLADRHLSTKVHGYYTATGAVKTRNVIPKITQLLGKNIIHP
jgi:hypothetical protein